MVKLLRLRINGPLENRFMRFWRIMGDYGEIVFSPGELAGGGLRIRIPPVPDPIDKIESNKIK